MADFNPNKRKLTIALIVTNVLLAIGLLALLLTEKSCSNKPQQTLSNLVPPQDDYTQPETDFQYPDDPKQPAHSDPFQDTIVAGGDVAGLPNTQLPRKDSIPSEPDELGSKGNIGCLDIIMCIDCTGSMGPIIDMVKNKAINFYPDIKRLCHEQGKEIQDMRIKVISFRDFRADGRNALKQSSFYNIPSQQSAFKSHVSSLRPGGGGDADENSLEALAVAIKSNWKKEGQKLRHVVLLWTDADPHEIGKVRGPGYPSGIPSSLGGLKSAWNGSGIYQKGKCMILFTPNSSKWNSVSSWDNTFHCTFTNAGLSSNYNRVIKKIADTI